MDKKYYVYAGYYEAWITDRILRRPLVYLGSHRTLGAAVRHAERLDPEAILFDESIRDEAERLPGFRSANPWKETEIPTFNGSAHSITNGLTPLTGEHFRCAAGSLPDPQDMQDILQWIHHLTGAGIRKLRSRLRGKTYSELLCIITAAQAA